MMKSTVPTPGTNKLTERLLAQGVKLDDPSTWPEGVWAGDANNFCYSREWRFTPTWESPCGLLIHSHGDCWGDTWVNGELHCSENDNPLFRCPTPGKPCQHRLKLPAGINCQFHRTDREWSEAESAERLYQRYDDMLRRQWEEDYSRYPGWSGFCANLRKEDMPDGTVRRTVSYKVDECIRCKCKSTQCICRNGAERDIKPANIFYDLYYERRYTDGLVPYIDKKMMKGMKVFDHPVARTDAEIALKIWRHDPDSPLVPMALRNKLNATEVNGIDDRRERYFVKHHRYWDGHTNVELYIEIRNIHIGKNEQRDMLQDLRDVQEGIKVEHRSDNEKAAKAVKSQSRQVRKIKKIAKVYANQIERGLPGDSCYALMGVKPELRQAVKDEAGKILEKRRQNAEKIAAKSAQVSIFDDLKE